MRRIGGFSVRWFYVLVVLVLALSLVVAGCSRLVGMATERALESAAGGQAQLGQNSGGITIKTGQGAVQLGGTNQWPAQMPPDVPELSSGKIAYALVKNGKGISVTMVNVNLDALDKYMSALQSAGWTIGTAAQSPVVSTIEAKKGKRQVVALFSSSGDQGLTVLITYSVSGDQ